MKAPFKLPARIDGNVLVAADCELICEVLDASPSERDYMLRAINHHDALSEMLLELLECCELNLDDLESATVESINRALQLVEQLKGK